MADLREPVSPADWARGPAAAPVTLVEYGDFACEPCAGLAPVLRRLQERFGDRLRLVYRHLPLDSSNPAGMLAAMAAEYAGERGCFWQMHDLLYAHQGELDPDHLAGYARQVGLDGDELRRQLDGGQLEPAVRQDLASGVHSGAEGAPTIFINGDRYDGPRTEHDLAEAIEHAMHVPFGEEVETTGYSRALPRSGEE